MKIVVDVNDWQRGFNDALAGRQMERNSYASGFIAGSLEQRQREAQGRRRTTRRPSRSNPDATSVDLPPRATAQTLWNRLREATVEAPRRQRRDK